MSNEVPQLVPDSFLTSVTREDRFCFSLCKWFLYVRLRSRVIPRYVGYRSQFIIVLWSKVTLMVNDDDSEVGYHYKLECISNLVEKTADSLLVL